MEVELSKDDWRVLYVVLVLLQNKLLEVGTDNAVKLYEKLVDITDSIDNAVRKRKRGGKK